MLCMRWTVVLPWVKWLYNGAILAIESLCFHVFQSFLLPVGLLPHNDYIVLFCHVLQEKQLLWSWKREEKGEYDAQGDGGIRKY